MATLKQIERKIRMAGVRASSEVRIDAKGKTYYFEDGNIYDEDGNHIGKAPNLAAAKKFLEENM